MKIVGHRGIWSHPKEQNSLDALLSCQKHDFGIETDLRSFKGKVFLSHDPIVDPSELVTLDQLLNHWLDTPHLPIFLNIKEDGLIPCLKPLEPLLNQLKVIFFDMSFPQLLKYSETFPKKMLATRFSEYEKEPLALSLCSWLWVDSFNLDPNPKELRRFIQDQKMSVAIVSPEIHQRDPRKTWNEFKVACDLPTDSVFFCTDFPYELLKESL